jgi:hypothetical protein
LRFGENYPTLEELVLMPNGSINQEYPPGDFENLYSVEFFTKIQMSVTKTAPLLKFVFKECVYKKKYTDYCFLGH